MSQELGLELEYFEISCFENGGMFTNAFGGTQPYSYNWDGPSFIDNGNGFIEIFIEGDYSVTVTDVNGCTAEESAFVGSQIGTEFLPINTQNVEFPILCDDESIYLYIDCNWCPIDTASVIWFLPDGYSVTGGSLWASEVGTYTASTNNGLCDFIGSIDVLPGGEFEYEIINTFCEDSSYFQVFQIFDQDIVVSITHQFLYLDLIEDFPDNFSGLIDYTSQFGCDGTLEYELPYAEGIDITLTSPPTCDTCIDGYIEVDYNDFSCECELGDAFVVSTDNIFDQYGLEELPSGDYYLLVNDINGCLIYVQEFSL